MEPVIVGLIGLAILFLLIFLRLPIGFAFLLVGVTGVGFLTTMGRGLSLLGTSPFNTASSYLFCVLPLFILMGLICNEAGLITEIYYFFYKWFGHLPGGLAIATMGSCAAYAAVSGESLSSASIMGKVALPEMRKYKYSPKFAAATIATGGTLGILIPPSAGFVLYGIITETSIGKLFIAGIVPGILLALLFVVVIYIRTKLNPSLGPPGPKAIWPERFVALKGAWSIFALFILVIGGIYAGIFTPTEAGAVGAFGAFIIGLLKRKCTKAGLITSLREMTHITGMVFIIIIGAIVFNYFITMSKLAMAMAGLVVAFGLSPYLVLTFIILIILVLGCIMEVPAMILLTMPIFFPIITEVGFDPIWFGVMSVLLSEAALITPPVGMNVYVVAGVAKDVPAFDIFRSVLPFLLAIIVCIVITTIFPQIVLFLPNMMKG